MKKSLFLLFLTTVFCFHTQAQIAFPQDFRLEPQLLSEMVIAEIPEEYHSEGITDNPAVTKDQSVIRMMSDLDNDDIIQIYYEIYQGIVDERDDAGVIVSEFVSKEALHNCLSDLKSQGNLGYLTKDNYLIQIWSDSSKHRQEHLDKMVNYYQNKLQAEIYKIGEDTIYEDGQAVEEIDITEEAETL